MTEDEYAARIAARITTVEARLAALEVAVAALRARLMGAAFLGTVVGAAAVQIVERLAL